MSDTSPRPSPPALPPDFPDAYTPHMKIGPPNEPIRLFGGQIKFTQRSKAFRADSRIELAWLPAPEVRFAASAAPPGVIPGVGDVSLALDDGTTVDQAFISETNLSVGKEGYAADVSGAVLQGVIQGSDCPARHVSFLLPNFPRLIGSPAKHADGTTRASRLSLQAGGWLVTLDAVTNDKEVEGFLKARAGYAVTHVGRLEREDSRSFTAKDARGVLDALACYTSFATGRWTGPCLPAGFDASGKQVWQTWDYSRTAPYRTRFSWLDTNHGVQFEEPFTGFLKLWQHENWKEVIQVAIHWYIEANSQAGSIEGSIVLTQTAFELLASAVLVENCGWLSVDGYERLAAADRIRLLFRWAGVPTEIPAGLDDLARQAKADNWPDTVTAMTMIRNTITHPTKKNREKYGKHLQGARTEAWTLGLWYLELCLLRLFEYRGKYGNRITQRFVGEIEAVPWSAEAKAAVGTE